MGRWTDERKEEKERRKCLWVVGQMVGGWTSSWIDRWTYQHVGWMAGWVGKVDGWINGWMDRRMMGGWTVEMYFKKEGRGGQ